MENIIERIIPKKNRILIQPKQRGEVTKSGIILPESDSNATPVMGTIIAAGNESEYAVGQTVLWRRFSVDELKIETPEEEIIMYFVEDDEVIAVIKDESN